jgi:threonylcarbamoyladenosine tRNA methylthiotransferase CDKAL1
MTNIGTTPDCNSLRQLQNKRVYIRTFGCTYNHGDSRKLAEILGHQGCRVVQSPDTADAIIINSCTVIEKTALKVLRTIARFDNKELYITGCMPEVEPERILEICSPFFITPRCIQETYRRNATISPSHTGIIQIAQGCNGRCSYCITRFARGHLQSFSMDEICSQAEQYIRGGAVEIQLTAQDVSSWGVEKGGSLPDLLANLITLDGDFRIRIGMMNPKTLKNIILGLIPLFESEKIFKFVHIPLQSGSDDVLGRMLRGYSVNDAVNLVNMFRKKIPDIYLMTDMIVGFPGESEADFQSSLSLIRQIRPNKVHITRFSKRPHTTSVTLPDFTDYVKKKRSRKMNLLAEELYHQINAQWLGQIVPVIVTEKIREGSVIARSQSYQGVVLKDNLPVGTQCNAILIDERMYFFIGSRIESPYVPWQ